MKKILYCCESKIPTFYCEILLAWYMCRVKGKVVMNTSSEILWFNQNIIFEKKLIFFKNWFQSGTAYIKDIF